MRVLVKNWQSRIHARAHGHTHDDLASLWWLPVLIATGVLVYPVVLLLVWSIAHRP